MKKNENTNLVAGRLSRNAGSQNETNRRATAYDVNRLGISRDQDPSDAQAQSTMVPCAQPDSPAQQTPPAASKPLPGSLAHELRRVMAQQSTDEQTDKPVVIHYGSPNIRWRPGRRILLLSPALAVVAVVVAIWCLWSWSDKKATTPQTATAAPAAAAAPAAIVQPVAVAVRTAAPAVAAPAAKPTPAVLAQLPQPAIPTQARTVADQPVPDQAAVVDAPVAVPSARILPQALPVQVASPAISKTPSALPQQDLLPRLAIAPATQQPQVVSVLTPPAITPPQTAVAKPQTPPSSPKPEGAKYGPCPSNIRLTGIVRRRGAYMANINGRFVRVGETVADAKVLEIRDRTVEMELKGERFEAMLAPVVEEAIPEPDKQPTSQPASAPANK